MHFLFVSLCFVLFVLFYLDSQLLFSTYLCCVDNDFLSFCYLEYYVFFYLCCIDNDSLSFYDILSTMFSLLILCCSLSFFYLASQLRTFFVSIMIFVPFSIWVVYLFLSCSYPFIMSFIQGKSTKLLGCSWQHRFCLYIIVVDSWLKILWQLIDKLGDCVVHYWNQQ